jgi:hypothetical protein
MRRTIAILIIIVIVAGGAGVPAAAQTASPTPAAVAGGTVTITATTAAPLVPGDDGNPGFGLWLLAIVGLAAIFVLGQATLRGRQPVSSPSPPSSDDPGKL